MKLLFTTAMLIVSCNLVASECEERCFKEFYKCLNTTCNETIKILTESYNKVVELLENSINNTKPKTDIQTQFEQTKQKAEEIKGLLQVTLGCSGKMNQCKTQCPR